MKFPTNGFGVNGEAEIHVKSFLLTMYLTKLQV